MVTTGYPPTSAPQFVTCISHDNRMAGELKHFDIVMVITDGHDLFAPVTSVSRPALQSMALRTPHIEHVDHRQVSLRVLSSQDRYQIFQSGPLQHPQGSTHPVHCSAEHRLHRISDQGVLDRYYELDILHILLEPASDAGAEFIEPFQNN